MSSRRKGSVDHLRGIELQDLGRSRGRAVQPGLLVIRMVSCVKGDDELDQLEIRKELKRKHFKTWKEVLYKLLEHPLFKGTNPTRFSKDNSGRIFLHNLLFSCVEEDLHDHLEVTIKWIDDVEKAFPQEFKNEITSFKKNNKAMLRACKKNRLSMVSALKRAGFGIETQLLKKESMMNMDDKDLMLELSRLEAMAKPAYLISHFLHDNTMDPIVEVLRTINGCSKIAGRRLSMINKIEEIRTSAKDFLLKIFDLCENSGEIKTFLNKDDDLGGISLKGTMLLPRINQAMQLHFKEFVNHDYCQQEARRLFYRDTSFKNRTDGHFVLLERVCLQALKTPFVCFGHTLAKLQYIASCTEEDPNRVNGYRTALHFDDVNSKKNYKNFDVPVNRMVSHAAAYILFVVLIIISLENPSDTPGILDFNWSYNFTSLIMAVGFIMKDIEDMYLLALSVNADKSLSRSTSRTSESSGTTPMCFTNKIEFARKTMKKCWGFFGNSFHNFKFLGHFLFLLGALVQGLGYNFDPHYVSSQNTSAGLNVTEKENTTVRHKVLDDDASSYEGFHLVKVGICLQGIAILIVMTHLLQFFRLHPALSVFYGEGIKCAKIVGSFFITYGFITLTFTLALYFVLRNAMIYPGSESCAEEQVATFTSLNSTLKILVLSLFDPGYPETIDDCSSGISHFVGLVLWFSYYGTVTIVILNLLIALMNVKTQNDLENGIETWKFHRIQLWMRFCNKSVTLPPPMNLVDIIITVPTRFIR